MLDVVEELGERVVASRSEPGDDAAARAQVCGEMCEHRPASVWVEEGQDVACADRDIERFRDSDRGEVEFSEVCHQPGWTGVIVLGGGDEDRVDVDAHDVVPSASEVAAHSSGSAPCVEDSGSAGDHGIDETCFAVEIVAGGSHRAEPFDVPGGVLWILLGQFDPLVARHGKQR